MLRFVDEIAGEEIRFHYLQNSHDFLELKDFIRARRVIAIDTESTGLNCYHPQWTLRTVQCGNAVDSYVVPARFRRLIKWIMSQDIQWIGHNGPHDIRCIDAHLGFETGVVCAGETYIPAHHRDSRGPEDGGTGHGLKELSMSLVDWRAGKWEVELKAAFKEITVPVAGEFYKSGPRKGEPKTRKARLAEGWSLIDPTDPRYIAYAAADPILTYRVWRKLRPTVREFQKLYEFDHRVQHACDRLQRRAMALDVAYTKRLSKAYLRKAEAMKARAREYGCENINSGQQIADVLLSLGAKLTARTPTGKWVTDDKILRGFLATGSTEVRDFVRSVLLAKQVLKRRASYTESMLAEMDSSGRIHPSINSIAARTTRMSVSNPPLQQLPTKDREEDNG